ncbi:MAG: class I SAM-dependent methyltransferase [Planctomycetota bacterium]|nr:class I SAM-dependent methyltransferase [Planctomycetota bacterium]
MSDVASSWLADQEPFDEETSQAQIEGLLAMLGSEPRRVLDLGCGLGRILLPLVEAGHEVVGLDREPVFLDQCRETLQSRSLEATLKEGNFFETWPEALGLFDSVLCLGNTFLMLWDVDDAVMFMQAVRTHLNPGGALVLDDLPHEYWTELTEGNWLSGISEDESSQMVWSSHDAVFAIRHGDEVDAADWSIGASDTPMRLWTSGALRLVARVAGLSGPHCQAESRLLVMPFAASSLTG